MMRRAALRIPRQPAIALALLGLLSCGLQGQSASGQIAVLREDYSISKGGPEFPLTEPHAAVHPNNPDLLAVGAIVAPVDEQSKWSCAAFVSADGGASWRRTDFEFDGCIDPWVIFAEGGLLFSAIELGKREDPQGFRLLQFLSADNGQTWPDQPRRLGHSHDHALIAGGSQGTWPLFLVSRRSQTAPSGAPRHVLFLARSDAPSAPFTPVATVEPSNLALNATGLAVSKTSLLISFFDFQRNVDGFGRQGMLKDARAWLIRSDDGGKSFSAPMLILDDCASGAEGSFPGYPFLAMDAGTGPFAGRLYHACARPGLDGILISHSKDLGEQWSSPLRLAPAGLAGQASSRTPMLAVNGSGSVGAAWYDRGEDEQRLCQNVYFTASLDGGKSYLPPVKVSRADSCPQTPENGRAGRSWASGGDYSSLTAGPDGAFHLFWADSRSGLYEIRHSILSVSERLR